MLPKFDTNYKPTFQKTQRPQSNINTHTKKTTLRHNKIKPLKTGHKKISLNTKKKKMTYQVKKNKVGITTDFSSKTMQDPRQDITVAK